MKTKIIKILSSSGGIVSGLIIGKELGISRVAVNKHIKTLIERGISIVAHSKGYQYIPSDTLDEVTLSDRLERQHLNIIPIVKTVDSTNTYSKTIPKEKDVQYLIVSKEQKSGRGRLEREFHSAIGGVYMTYMRTFDNMMMQDSLNLVLIAGVAVAMMLEEYGLKPNIKWPNDVLINSKKVCGILLESSLNEYRIDTIFQGIGINVNNVLSEDILEIATSMSLELGGVIINREDVIARVLYHLDRLIKGYLDVGQKSFAGEYISRSRTIGNVVSVSNKGDKIVGKAVGLSPIGYLMMEIDGGQPIEIVAGDVM